MSSSEELVWSHFGPVVLTVASSQCNEICLKNNLSFCELVKPFGSVGKGRFVVAVSFSCELLFLICEVLSSPS